MLMARYSSGPALEVARRALALGLAVISASWAAATREELMEVAASPASAMMDLLATDSS